MAEAATAGEGWLVPGGVRLGRLSGIEIVVNWSLIVIFWLIAVNLGGGTLPTFHPEWSVGLDWVVAVIAAVLFFGSVLVHEMAHALVAQRYGVSVPRIVLFLFGGVSELGREPPSPKAEFFIAAAGPATSVVLGVLGTAVGTWMAGPLPAGIAESSVELIRRSGPVGSVLLWLGPINVLLGLFNLVPGFPLDGGRVLRSLLWWRTGDLRRATLWASRTGQVVALVLMGIGVGMAFGVSVPFFGYGFFPGLWLALIGWFLLNAARASYEDVFVREALQDVPVGSVMQSRVVTLSPDVDVESLVRDHIMQSDQQAFPVLEDGQLVGLVTLQDVRRVAGDTWGAVTVRSIMTPAAQLVTVGPRDRAGDALQALVRRDVEQLPVVDGGRVVGLLRRKDIMKWLGLRQRPGEMSSARGF